MEPAGLSVLILPCPSPRERLDFLKACAQKRAPKAAQLRGIRVEVFDAYLRYDGYVRELTTAVPLKLEQKKVQALKLAYEDTHLDGRLQGLRDTLFANARAVHPECPMCQASSIEQLDHFLPQSVFPEFSLLASNLVPVCGACNTLKGDQVDLVAGDSFVHHYLDQLPTVPLLEVSVRVMPGRPPAARFQLRPASGPASEPREVERFRYQFQKLALARRFLAAASNDVTRASNENTLVGARRGWTGVQGHMRVTANMWERERGVNHWLTALYRGLEQSDAYCRSFPRSPARPRMP